MGETKCAGELLGMSRTYVCTYSKCRIYNQTELWLQICECKTEYNIVPTFYILFTLKIDKLPKVNLCTCILGMLIFLGDM